MQDITERRRAEAAVRESEARLQAVLDGARDPIFLKDREGRLLLANPTTFAVIGKPAEACLGKTDEQFYDNPADGRAITANDRRIIASGQAETVEERVCTPSGTRYYVSHKTPYRDAAGDIIGLIGTGRDITERKQAEEALYRSEMRYRTLVETTTAVTWHCPPSGLHVEPQPAWMAFTGQTADEMLGDGWTKVTHPEDLPKVAEHWIDAVSRGEPFVSEHRIRRHDGCWRWISVHAVPIRDASGEIVEWFGMNIDITERKQAEHALRESEERERQRRLELETMLAVIPVAVFIAEDKACTRITANPAGYELLKIPEGSNASKSAPEGERPTYETYSATGELLTANKLPIQQAADTGKPIHGAEHELRFVGGDHKHILGNALPLFGASGHVIGAVGAFWDITERKHQEERIKVLLREVNHRAKNMLALVQAIARQTVVASPNEFLERFSERVRALATSQDLLVNAEWKGVELAEIVCLQLAHFQDLIGSRIELEGPSFLISASAAQTLGMAIHELATNAGKYGALSNAEGRVAVHWGLERDGGAFTISWREQRGPAVAPPSRNGFGSTVIGRLAESSLDGRVDLEFLRTGLFWRLRCPAAGVIEGTHSSPASEARSRAQSSLSLMPDGACRRG